MSTLWAKVDVALGDIIASLRGQIHDALLSRLSSMRYALLRYIASAQASMSDDEAIGFAFVVNNMLSDVKICGSKASRSQYAFSVMIGLHWMFAAAGIRQVRPAPRREIEVLPPHLQEVILAKADELAREQDVHIATYYAQNVMRHTFNESYEVQYYAYRFLTKRVAAHWGASELNPVMPPDGNDWWGLLRVYMEGDLGRYVCRADASTPCTPNNERQPCCLVCSEAYQKGYRLMFVRFHTAFCDQRPGSMGPGRGRKFMDDVSADPQFAVRVTTCR